VRIAAAEVSSIGIAEGRVDRPNFCAGLFTNLGRDHLDYHGSIEGYFAAKLRLFTEILPRSRRTQTVTVACGDDPYGQRILDTVAGRKVSFGLAPSRDVHPLDFAADLSGIRATISALGSRIAISSPLLGEPNLMNVLGASALSVALGIEPGAVEEGARRCPGAPGRMEAIPTRRGVNVLVDYAHKPDALEAVLRTVRKLTPGKIICVFGCGGDRDRGKRPLMGAVASRHADAIVLTSDNPRGEDPAAIIAGIEEGVTARHKTIVDRREAIARAIAAAGPPDVVLLAGKGHETTQEIAGRKLPFSDTLEAERALAGWGR